MSFSVGLARFLGFETDPDRVSFSDISAKIALGKEERIQKNAQYIGRRNKKDVYRKNKNDLNPIHSPFREQSAFESRGPIHTLRKTVSFIGRTLPSLKERSKKGFSFL
ncbi:hypothetical protein CH371_16305 [Leptospira wolffii]|uniref:Uncharacterized protein n=1 Tax=Leptospira wolffii TaxID=409998 RepID=A0A2M9Z8D3_9LEPT|nr:hypothetical protein CH371_16305 [Leptospira wolffii]